MKEKIALVQLVWDVVMTTYSDPGIRGLIAQMLRLFRDYRIATEDQHISPEERKALRAGIVQVVETALDVYDSAPEV